jgi:hypothetical protein
LGTVPVVLGVERLDEIVRIYRVGGQKLIQWMQGLAQVEREPPQLGDGDHFRDIARLNGGGQGRGQLAIVAHRQDVDLDVRLRFIELVNDLPGDLARLTAERAPPRNLNR